MNIALIGYGKMGKTIESVAISRGHRISHKIDLDNPEAWDNLSPENTDVAIEFTGPHSAFENVKKCIEKSVPLVCGSTGWLDKFDEIVNLTKKLDGSFLYASNFSVGVNIFFELNKKLAQLMASHPEYDVSLKEVHHTQKKDAPSGTAITLAEEVLANIRSKKYWVNRDTENPDELSVTSERIDPAPGTHHIRYHSAIDDIEIIHTAHSRNGFALGAVLAAEFLPGKKGVFGMKEVLGI
ncbi:4-hydroxy-tetrahydrodipicolinate reductase [Pollutibacter soli]|uniref:4-hydroxy-tetrahydrodipicolinate reductase n=1 Tax=Pollutibacter soli TaxID=3034157 RepID=UPI003013B952